MKQQLNTSSDYEILRTLRQRETSKRRGMSQIEGTRGGVGCKNHSSGAYPCRPGT